MDYGSVPLLTVLQEYFENYKIVSGGREVAVPCIFHDDHDHHLYINLSTGLYHCFVCQESGNWEKLSKIIGVDPKSVRLRKAEVKSIETEVDKRIFSLFSLECPVDLLRAGFSARVLFEHEVGFDHIRKRIVFPIRDISGKLVGLSGRTVLPDFQPRYKFYIEEIRQFFPDYEFRPHDHLYHAHHVKGEPIIIVEGFKACLWLVQNGFENTVALMGSSLSYQQLLLLGSLGSDFILFLDNDEAGIRATDTIYNRLLSLGRVRIIAGNKSQPDDYTQEELKELISSPVSLLKFRQISAINTRT